MQCCIGIHFELVLPYHWRRLIHHSNKSTALSTLYTQQKHFDLCDPLAIFRDPNRAASVIQRWHLVTQTITKSNLNVLKSGIYTRKCGEICSLKLINIFSELFGLRFSWLCYFQYVFNLFESEYYFINAHSWAHSPIIFNLLVLDPSHFWPV